MSQLYKVYSTTNDVVGTFPTTPIHLNLLPSSNPAIIATAGNNTITIKAIISVIMMNKFFEDEIQMLQLWLSDRAKGYILFQDSF